MTIQEVLEHCKVCEFNPYKKRVTNNSFGFTKNNKTITIKL